MGEKCSTGCRTKDHGSFADCMRSKQARVAYCNSASGSDYTTQKKWDANLDAYRDARKQGIQPAGTSRTLVDRAVRISNETGSAWKA